MSQMIHPPTSPSSMWHSDDTLGHKKLFLNLRRATLAGTVLALTLICVVIQLAWGADAGVLTLSLMSCLAGLAGLHIAGTYNGAGWLAFFFVLGNSIIALMAKTALLQPIDSH